MMKTRSYTFYRQDFKEDDAWYDLLSFLDIDLDEAKEYSYWKVTVDINKDSDTIEVG